MDTLDGYVAQLQESIDTLKIQSETIIKMANVIGQAIQRGNQILIAGNGGSSASASHFAVDISKGVRMGSEGLSIRAMCLSDNTPQLTAWANDYSYDMVFSEQVHDHCSQGDIFLAISCSGESENILRAIEQAREKGGYCLGLSGFGGGELLKKADLAITVPAARIQQVEDVHHVILHLIAVLVREHLTGDAQPTKSFGTTKGI